MPGYLDENNTWVELSGPDYVDPRQGNINVNPSDPYANTYYDPSVAGPNDANISGPSMSYDPTTGTNTLYDAGTGETFGGPFGGSSGGGGLGGLLKSFGNLISGKQKIGGDNGVGLDQLLSLFMMAKVLGGGKGFMAPQPVGYQGGIPKYTATRTQIPQPAYVPYSGQAVMGGKQLSDVQYAAKGGIMGLRNGAFVIPADVVSHFGNGSSEAGMEFLAKKLGATLIKGKGDGMSDSIDTTIDGKQPAKVAHEEAIVSPEKVAELGDGDPKKGAKTLYAMMDRVRKARTGTKKQGKQIKPEKFMPGGVASLAGGGAVAFNGTTGSSVTSPSTGSSTSSNLSEWAGPYITGMLGQAQALAGQDYQAYQGPLTAGYSPLQQQAFTNYQNYQAPAAIGQAAQTAGSIAGQMQGLQYSPTQFGNQFQGPGAYQAGQFNAGYDSAPAYQATQFGNQFQGPSAYQTGIFSNQFQGPGAYEAGQFTNQFTGSGEYSPTTATAGFNAPDAYQGVDFTGGLTPQTYQAGQFANQFQGPNAYQAGSFNTGLGSVGSVQSYMNPYLQGVTDIEAREARRQADITGAAQQAKMVKAGAFGGSRDAIMRAELARNLGTQIGDITSRGLNTAYDKALSQRLAESQASMEAQKAREASRQFGAGQGMTAAQLQAQYGLSAQQASEASRQFGANFGLQGLQSALQAAQAQGQLGVQQGQLGLQGLAAQLGAGEQQRAIEQQGIAAKQAEFEKQRLYPYQQLQFQQSMLQGLPISTYSNTPNTSGYQDLQNLLAQLQALGKTATGV